VEGQQSFLARLGFDVLEDLLFVIDQEVAVLIVVDVYAWHVVAPFVQVLSVIWVDHRGDTRTRANAVPENKTDFTSALTA
jgi:hypothetical protein